MSFGSFLKSHSGLLHSIGDALKLLQSATPLIGGDAAKLSGIIQAVHDTAHQVGVIAETADEGIKIDPNAVKDALSLALPGLLSEGISLAMEKLLPQHTAAVVQAATEQLASKSNQPAILTPVPPVG